MERPELDDLLETIKSVVLDEARRGGVEVKDVILFGSRARGDYREDSDWDVLIVVDDSTGKEGVGRLRFRVYRRLAGMKIYCDVVVVRESYYRGHRDVVGTVAYYASLEGRSLG